VETPNKSVFVRMNVDARAQLNVYILAIA